ncbi:uncharacterized protein G2W53_016631 [Senna tora]|uniref:Uncharacterized protein n=1 Tax=Senna tora TaxID=362788 RepID=A0A834TPK8_9FABA|nr:uncharacterized protein G2W53_016631 [Senna tora]
MDDDYVSGYYGAYSGKDGIG